MKNPMYAKSDGETIEGHTTKLVEALDRFLTVYNGYLTPQEVKGIRYACLRHDVGKLNSRFQNKIIAKMGRSERIGCELDEVYKKYNVEEIPHGVLSATLFDYDALADELGSDAALAIVTAVYNHHYRYIETKAKGELEGFKIHNIIKREFEFIKQDTALDISLNLKNLKKNQINVSRTNKLSSFMSAELWQKFILYKGMLNKLDYAASAGETDIEISPSDATIDTNNAMQKAGYTLNDCQRFMLAHKNDNIVVTASTGIGKTEAALLWQGNAKTFYTLPLKVAINAIYDRIKEKGYYPRDKVVFLHSDTITSLLKEDAEIGDIFANYNKIKNLQYPLTVCTVDQLFVFVFKALGTELIPATLRYSKIIIDEIQSYSPEILAQILYGLITIHKLGGRFCIMTATLPPIVGSILKDNDVDFVEPQAPFYKISDKTGLPILRHNIARCEGDFDCNEIALEGKSKKVLVIVNTVFRAQTVYDNIKKCSDNVRLLHSRFRAEDRIMRQEEIIKFANSAGNGVWVSTQIVEASLDIDFDLLYTDMCTADSLLQRLGRCYRSRDYEGETPNVKIYNTRCGVGAIYDKDIYQRSWDFLADIGNGPFSEEAKTNYIAKVYDSAAIEDTDYLKAVKSGINSLINLLPAYFDKGESLKKFRNIRNISIIYYKDYNALLNDGTVDRLRSDIDKKERLKLLEKVRGKSINIQERSRYGKNKIDVERCDIEGFWVTRSKYDEDKGLTHYIDEESGTL